MKKPVVRLVNALNNRAPDRKKYVQTALDVEISKLRDELSGKEKPSAFIAQAKISYIQGMMQGAYISGAITMAESEKFLRKLVSLARKIK